MWRLCVCIAVAVAFPACALRPLPGAVATAEEPLHAESGVGVTIWKFPIVGIGGWGGAGRVPEVVVYNYNYQAVPPLTTPSGIPAQPPGPPQPVTYPTTFPLAPQDYPTLAIFVNQSTRATAELKIDDGESILLAPGEATSDLRLAVGSHTVKVRWYVPTHFGTQPTPQRVMPLEVNILGRGKIIYLSEF